MVDVIFVHRDADSPDAERRHSEVVACVRNSACSVPCVAVVPVQELEAWLLLDEAEIRRVAGRPSGRRPLVLPKPKAAEATNNPKEVLAQALADAGEASGRRLAAARKAYPQRRRALLERLDIDGPVCRLSSWRRLASDIADAVALLDARV